MHIAKIHESTKVTSVFIRGDDATEADLWRAVNQHGAKGDMTITYNPPWHFGNVKVMVERTMKTTERRGNCVYNKRRTVNFYL